jgi:hypothetical protein
MNPVGVRDGAGEKIDMPRSSRSSVGLLPVRFSA